MLDELIAALKWRIVASRDNFVNRRKMRKAEKLTKVFCIGLNKTGTTSWAKAMADLGYVVGSETVATMLFYDWVKRDFVRIMQYCQRDGQAFQDYPFSLPDTYREMDKIFPGSKFILTVRDSAEQWYQSTIRFHSKNWSESGSVPPTPEDLKKSIYWKRGFLADHCREVFNTPIDDPYNREKLLSFYRNYNRDVCDYFDGRDEDFLVLNVSQPGAMEKMCTFLKSETVLHGFPWENRT